MTTTKPVVDSLTMQGKGMPENDVPPQTIIPSALPKFSSGGIIPSSIRAALEPRLPGETIIRTEPNCSAHYDDEFIIRPTSEAQAAAGKNYSDMLAAEQRRQSVQAEAMVNLAVGIVLTRQGQTSIGISKQDLADFQQAYTVNQQIGDDGGFIITVTPKE